VEVEVEGRPALNEFSGPALIFLPPERISGPKKVICRLKLAVRVKGELGEEANMFALLWKLLIGLIVGAVAKLLTPGKDGGIWITMALALGIAGSILATYLGRFLGWHSDGQAAGVSCRWSARF
jgi:uncharacterized membrane protein YeaQ/YmgE (transglycosylase-associated protein family)